MPASGQETEAKFYVRDLKRIKSRLEELDAQLIQERVLETNTRFDLPGARLRAEGRVLRLRRDTDVRLTYKSASKREDGVLSREEIEFVVEDFEKAKRFLEALGYQKLFYYEKFRTTYALQPSEGFVLSHAVMGAKPSEDSIYVMLDELPYGNFVEIEGATVTSIRALARQLNLNWEAAIATSYSALFERARKSLNLPFHDLSFAEFRDIGVDALHLGVRAADA
ncbi:MAG TPA: class IV adenylate cyclase [Anaerolineales bacterium]|nr:class IV adenylate cyclase [Anaerolineales bacterium]